MGIDRWEHIFMIVIRKQMQNTEPFTEEPDPS